MAERRPFTSKLTTAATRAGFVVTALQLALAGCSSDADPELEPPATERDASHEDTDTGVTRDDDVADSGPSDVDDDTTSDSDAGRAETAQDASTDDRAADAETNVPAEAGVPEVIDDSDSGASPDASMLPNETADSGAATDAEVLPVANDAAPVDAAVAVDASDAEVQLPPGSAFPEFDGGTARQFTEVENNNALSVANDLGHGSASVRGTLYPTTEVDIFQLELLYPTHLTVRVHDTSDDPDVIGCNEFAMDVDLLNAAGSEVVSGTGTDGCAYFDSRLQSNARSLAPGIYYLRLRANTSKPSFDEYLLEVSYVSECGDGVLQGEETCDGSENCEECQRIPSCGDGFVDVPSEGCEDTGPDDGCNAQCQREFISEIEPNDTPEDAVTHATDDVLVVSSDTLLGGSLQSPDERDEFVVRAAQDSIVFVSVFDTPSGAGCVEAPRIEASLNDMQDTLLRGYWPFGCAAFAVNVPMGDHVLSVSDPLGSASFDNHRVEVDFVEVLGTEAEPANNTLEGATDVRPQGAFGAVAFTGSLSEVDHDWYSVEVPGRHELLIDTLPDDPAVSRCAPEDLDIGIIVYDAAGVEFANNSVSDDGSYCGKAKVLNRLPEAQRFDVQVLTDQFWVGEFDYRVVFKTRHAAP